MTQQFKAGDKVRIIEGGWGIHPAHVGKIVTIHASKGNGRYTTVESLTSLTSVASSFPHVGKESSADYRSFELVSTAPNTFERVREINNLIRELQAEKAALVDAITADLEL